MSVDAVETRARPVVLVCGWAGAGNVGDELLTRAVVEVLRDAGARVVVRSRRPAATEADHPGVDAVAWGPGAVARAGRVDGVVVGPGGILQDRSSLWNLPAHLAPALVVRRRGRPVVAVGVGAEPVRRRSSRRLLRAAIGGVPVVVRDQESAVALRAAGLAPVVGADLAFGVGLPGPVPRDEIVVAVGPGIVPGRLLPAARRVGGFPVAEVAEALDRLRARTGLPLAFVAFRGERDRQAAVALASRLGVVEQVLGLDEQVARVAGARLVVSSRYHATVVAARAGTPVVVHSDEAKLGALASLLGPQRVRSLDSWADLGALDDIPARVDPPAPPPGLAVAHHTLRAFVATLGGPGEPPGPGWGR